MDEHARPEAARDADGIADAETRYERERCLNEIAVEHRKEHGGRNYRKAVAVAAERLHYNAPYRQLLSQRRHDGNHDKVDYPAEDIVRHLVVGRGELKADTVHDGDKDARSIVARKADKKAEEYGKDHQLDAHGSVEGKDIHISPAAQIKTAYREWQHQPEHREQYSDRVLKNGAGIVYAAQRLKHQRQGQQILQNDICDNTQTRHSSYDLYLLPVTLVAQVSFGGKIVLLVQFISPFRN